MRCLKWLDMRFFTIRYVNKINDAIEQLKTPPQWYETI